MLISILSLSKLFSKLSALRDSLNEPDFTKYINSFLETDKKKDPQVNVSSFYTGKPIINLRQEYNKTLKASLGADKYQYVSTFNQMFAKISYSQIKEAIEIVESMDSVKYNSGNFLQVLQLNFGIPFPPEENNLAAFKKVYKSIYCKKHTRKS